jgi:hypothetical protein
VAIDRINRLRAQWLHQMRPDLGRLDPGAEILRVGPNMTSIETTGRLAPFPARW